MHLAGPAHTGLVVLAVLGAAGNGHVVVGHIVAAGHAVAGTGLFILKRAAAGLAAAAGAGAINLNFGQAALFCRIVCTGGYTALQFCHNHILLFIAGMLPEDSFCSIGGFMRFFFK